MLFATLFLAAPLQAAPPVPFPVVPSIRQAAPVVPAPPAPPRVIFQAVPGPGLRSQQRAGSPGPEVRFGLRPIGQSDGVATDRAPVAPANGTMGVQIADRNGDTPAVIVVGVLPGSVAESAGLAAQDRLVEIDGQAVSDTASLTAALGGKSAGETVEVAVQRDGERRTFRFELGGSRGQPVDSVPEQGWGAADENDDFEWSDAEIEVEVETEWRLGEDGDVRVFRWSGEVDDGVVRGFLSNPDGEMNEFEIEVEEGLAGMLTPLQRFFESQGGFEGLIQQLPDRLEQLEGRCDECAQELEARLETWERRFSDRMENWSQRMEDRVERFERRLERGRSERGNALRGERGDVLREEARRGRAQAGQSGEGQLFERLRRNEEELQREATRRRGQVERELEVAMRGAQQQAEKAQREAKQKAQQAEREAMRQREVALERGREVERELLQRERDELRSQVEKLRAEVERLQQRLDEPRDN